MGLKSSPIKILPIMPDFRVVCMKVPKVEVEPAPFRYMFLKHERIQISPPRLAKTPNKILLVQISVCISMTRCRQSLPA